MSMKITVKNENGEVIGARGKRRAVVDGKLMNQAVSLKTGEWASYAEVEIEAKEIAELEAASSIKK